MRQSQHHTDEWGDVEVDECEDADWLNSCHFLWLALIRIEDYVHEKVWDVEFGDLRVLRAEDSGVA